MSWLFLNKNFRIFLFLFFASALSIAAQESNVYDGILKESPGKDFIKKNITMQADSNMYKMFLLRRISILLPYEGIFNYKEEKPKISPYVTMFDYKNYKGTIYDTRKFNGDGSFSGAFALAGDRLMSKGAYFMININGLLSLLPINHVKKESKKAKMLRTIKNDVYHVDE